jgi:hypothetical protein
VWNNGKGIGTEVSEGRGEHCGEVEGETNDKDSAEGA